MSKAGRYVRTTGGQDTNSKSNETKVETIVTRHSDESEQSEQILIKKSNPAPNPPSPGKLERLVQRVTEQMRGSEIHHATWNKWNMSQDLHSSTQNREVVPVGASFGLERISTDDRLNRLEKTITELTAALQAKNSTPRTTHDANLSCKKSRDMAASTNSGSTVTSMRWDNIKPFPKNVPAGKMLEAWNQYIEYFEIASSLNNAIEPVRIAQLLYFSMGDELQDIVRAAKLHPSLNDTNCYTTLVHNIEDYLRSMTDTKAEHEAFSNMRQERGESAVAFHARLMQKVRLCGYNQADHDRFVRVQLLRGLANRELTKAAGTFGYDVNYIVHSASRDEAYASKTRPYTSTDVVAVGQQRHGASNSSGDRKRKANASLHEPRSKRPRGDLLRFPGRRKRCSRCNQPSHTSEPCPALTKNCNTCGKSGHFSVSCRTNRINRIQKPEVSSGWTYDEVNSKE